MKKIYTADKETGTFIEEVKSLAEALMLIEQYEEEDKTNGDYTSDFYDVVNEDHQSIRYELSANIHLGEKHFASLEEAKEAAKKEQEYYIAHTCSQDIERNRNTNECIYIFPIGSDNEVDNYELY